MPENIPIVVFSHLRWDFVYQRPQHLLSRLAADRKVLFFEEPWIEASAEAYVLRSTPAPNVVVLRPHIPTEGVAFNDQQLPLLKPLLDSALKLEGVDRFVAWVYTPMAVPLVETLEPEAIVYDCMDELSAFKLAPPDLLPRESRLLDMADLVLTGGPSLYKAKQGRHDNLHCFSSSVDSAHFAGAKEVEEASDQKSIPHPKLGFYGVIDERLDLDLVDALAKSHPEWQVVMVGPVVKIQPEDLPKRRNLHWLGQRSYEELPAYLAGWDVCLLPFALNESTKFISPTKTLEYMAAGLPIVSTPITDVVEPYGHIVRIAGNSQEFIAACEAALSMSPQELKAQERGYQEVLSRTSWDSTAGAVKELIQQAIEAREAPPA